jgi:hypothetical protein
MINADGAKCRILFPSDPSQFEIRNPSGRPPALSVSGTDRRLMCGLLHIINWRFQI